jgi:hypothetical protein
MRDCEPEDVLTWAVTLPCSTIVRASAVNPLSAHPMCESISRIFSTLSLSSKGDCVRFSTASTTPPFVQIPTVVDPSCEGGGALVSRCRGSLAYAAKRFGAEKLTLMASMAYSTWKRRPSGEKVCWIDAWRGGRA